VEGVISVFGLSPSGKLTLNSDKGSAFVSLFFKSVCKLLGVRLIIRHHGGGRWVTSVMTIDDKGEGVQLR